MCRQRLSTVWILGATHQTAMNTSVTTWGPRLAPNTFDAALRCAVREHQWEDASRCATASLPWCMLRVNRICETGAVETLITSAGALIKGRVIGARRRHGARCRRTHGLRHRCWSLHAAAAEEHRLLRRPADDGGGCRARDLRSAGGKGLRDSSGMGLALTTLSGRLRCP